MCQRLFCAHYSYEQYEKKFSLILCLVPWWFQMWAQGIASRLEWANRPDLHPNFHQPKWHKVKFPLIWLKFSYCCQQGGQWCPRAEEFLPWLRPVMSKYDQQKFRWKELMSSYQLLSLDCSVPMITGKGQVYPKAQQVGHWGQTLSQLWRNCGHLSKKAQWASTEISPQRDKRWGTNWMLLMVSSNQKQPQSVWLCCKGCAGHAGWVEGGVSLAALTCRDTSQAAQSPWAAVTAKPISYPDREGMRLL